jgi:hypothetical protein
MTSCRHSNVASTDAWLHPCCSDVRRPYALHCRVVVRRTTQRHCAVVHRRSNRLWIELGAIRERRSRAGDCRVAEDVGVDVKTDRRKRADSSPQQAANNVDGQSDEGCRREVFDAKRLRDSRTSNRSRSDPGSRRCCSRRCRELMERVLGSALSDGSSRQFCRSNPAGLD